MYQCRDPSSDWTRCHLYLQFVGQVCQKIDAPVTCEYQEDGMMHSVSGLPRPLEAFVMMCVSVYI